MIELTEKEINIIIHLLVALKNKCELDWKNIIDIIIKDLQKKVRDSKIV